jgi:hypothetical protein
MCTERYFWRKDAVCRQIVLVQYYSTSVRSVSGSTRVLVLTATAQLALRYPDEFRTGVL